MRRFIGLVFLATSVSLVAQDQNGGWQPDLTRLQTYTSHRASSSDPTGANADARRVEPGASLTLLDTDGPGKVSHLWFTISSDEPYHLKRIVLRIYWDGEATPSVEAPIGDFFGLGLGDYYSWQSELLSVGSENSLNCFFPMPFQRHARITISNEGKQPVGSLYYNIDYQTDSHPLPPGTLYFHAQYRQAQPNHGWTNNWTSNGDPLVDDKRNLNGQDNYVWMEAKGSGQFVGVTMSVMQNQDGWWGEGDDMFFVDDDTTPAISWHRLGGLLPGRVGFWRQAFLLSALWGAGRRPGTGGQQVERLPFSSGRSHTFQEIFQGHHRARTRQPSLR